MQINWRYALISFSGVGGLLVTGVGGDSDRRMRQANRRDEGACGTQFSSPAAVNYKCDKWFDYRLERCDLTGWLIFGPALSFFPSFPLPPPFFFYLDWRRTDGSSEEKPLFDYSSNMCCEPVIEFKSPDCICATAERYWLLPRSRRIFPSQHGGEDGWEGEWEGEWEAEWEAEWEGEAQPMTKAGERHKLELERATTKQSCD